MTAEPPPAAVVAAAESAMRAVFNERTRRGLMKPAEKFTLGDAIRIAAGALVPHWPKAVSKPSKADSSPFGDRKVIPPTPKQVTLYSASVGFPLDGQKWCDAYEAKGWVVSGKTKMKDWQAAVRNWKANNWGQGSITLAGAEPKNGRDYSKI